MLQRQVIRRCEGHELLFCLFGTSRCTVWHEPAWREQARVQVISFDRAQPYEIISPAAERSNNLATGWLGVAPSGKHIITTSIEHPL
jgi:hypothetical protein